ncbi:MAG TPA: ATP-grasp domain-containing protein [Streptosporangiaceae bacterium]|jgi:biotin carboxylase|nr:ATP-grasp domain-containing protein [Streptosporangiaceae bacterium]
MTAYGPKTITRQKNLPNVLVLSGRRTVENLKAAGYRVGLASQSIPLDLALAADTPIEVNFDDWPAIIAQVERVHRLTPFDAVITHLEHLLPLAGRLRDRLGLSGGISERAALDCMDKPTTQRLLADAGLPVARFRCLTTPEQAPDAVAELGLPVIVKPPAASSGAGLTLSQTAEEAAAAAADLLAAGHEAVLMEEYLRGTEIGLFAYRLAGETTVITCLKAEVGPPPKFVKLGGEYPGDLEPAVLAEVSDLTSRALAAVGLDNWVATVQMMLTADGPRVMEINPRVPGGQTVELVAVTTGYEPTLVAADVALGQRPRQTVTRTPFAWYRCLVFEQAGHLFYRAEAEDHIPGLESPAPPVIELDVEPGEVVLPINHPRGGVFGRVIVRGDSQAILERDYARILAALDLRLEPLSDAEHEAVWRPHTRCC